MLHNTDRRREGFALAELIAIIVCIALLAAMLTIMGDRSRRTARLGEDIANLRQIGTWTRSYSADFADSMWGFSWKPGNYTTKWPDLQISTTDMQATAAQAVAILRERTGRPDIPRLSGWSANITYSHLPLADYVDSEFPARWAISSGDRHRLKWAADPECFDQGCFAPYQPTPAPGTERWPYGATFRLPAAFWDASDVGHRVSFTQTHKYFMVPSTASFGGLKTTQISHPSNKVMVHAQNGRHFGAREPYLILSEARVALLMSDGSAGVRSSADANNGVNPNTPNAFVGHGGSIIYDPDPWDPPIVATPPNQYDIGHGRYLWTRMGIAGRDFGGREVFPW